MKRVVAAGCLFFAPVALAQGRLSGTLHVQNPAGFVVIACLYDATTSNCDGQRSQSAPVNPDGSFAFADLEASPYLLIAWRDTNLSGQFEEGQDDVVTYSDASGQPALVSPPAVGLVLQPQPASMPQVPTSLVGEWYQGSGTGLDFYNPSTGEWAPPSGSGFSYVFGADGSYEYSGLMQSTLYSCGLSVFAYQAGQYAVQDNILALTPELSKMKSLSSCNRDSNWEKDLSPETEYRLFSFGTFPATGEPTLELHFLILNVQGQLEIDPANREAFILYRAP